MRRVSFILALVITTLSNAKDLGKYGHTYEIEEKDFVSVIEGRLEKAKEDGTLDKFQDEYQKRLSKQIKRPNKVEGITKVTENRIRSFDPTVELEEDIGVPNGEKINILYAKGTKINPLDYQAFDEAMIFIDGDDEAQKEFANSYFERYPNVAIILVNGEPGLKKIGNKEYFYYFDQAGAYSKRFNVTKVPSVIFQKEGDSTLTINEVNLDEKDDMSSTYADF